MSNKQSAEANTTTRPGFITPIFGFNPVAQSLPQTAANSGWFDDGAKLSALVEAVTFWSIFSAALVLEALMVNVMWLS